MNGAAEPSDDGAPREAGSSLAPLSNAEQDRLWRQAQAGSDPHLALGAPRAARMVRIVARLAKANRSPAPVRVVNVGLGAGDFERAALSQGFEVTAIDPDADSLARLASATAGRIRVQTGRLEALPLPDAACDVLVASEVIEHLDDAQRAAGLREVLRVLVPGGWFVGSVPDAEDLALTTCTCPRCGLTFHRFGHHARFESATLRDLLVASGFEVVRLERTAFVSFRGRSPRGWIKSAVRWLLAKWGEPIAAPSLVWTARRPPGRPS